MNGENQVPAPDGDANQWPYDPESMDAQQQSPAPVEEVQWTASEFIAHDKGFGWFALLFIATAVLAGLVYLISHDWASTGLVIGAAVILGIAAVRKPRVLTYIVNSHGLTIGQKFYPYSEFKSFSVVDEGAFSSVVFMPLKRFMPTITIYYGSEDEDRIIDVLALYLPMEEHKHDVFDQLIRRIHF